ncbi:MAG TPA: Asp-tRNA(Asn)/Glu-tRNA(Gln) amidotransferase subunit GatB [Bacilli bacterium]|nr:Asp-tRNA(Asn)/Glu-tRNA(Gln) amidotransferase subunit GatB [Bacilli bacterium]HPS18899.1 Asp-tRNA(Asn)/Glu-tRNA(Gln) amidotransferase subunit GatB [Bacilli bacterium]
MNFEAVIGLEIHVEMNTKSKMFSNAPVSYGSLPNSQTVALDYAFPGTLPTVNKQAVVNAIRICHALHMSIDNEVWFDRKNYFYSDLPKGYQITQQERPIGSNGSLQIMTSFGPKTISIERLHLEEDTCKQLHSWDCTLLDYNRAGIPLVEIVSRPDLRSGEEARQYAEKIRSIVSFLNVSTGKMEEGSLRVDVNISLRPVGSEKLGTKVEIKNLNSFANIEKAVDYEIKRQEKVLLSGESVIQETRRFDEGLKQTVLMRLKTDSVDYKYFTEPNIPPIHLSEDFIKQAIETSPELAEVKLTRYEALGLNEYDSQLLISDKATCAYFDEAIKSGANAKLLANWIIVDIQAILNKEMISIEQFNVSPKHLGKLVLMIEKQQVSNKQGRDIFQKLIEKDEDPETIKKTMGVDLISDVDMINQIVIKVIDDNPQAVVDYHNGKDRAVGFLVGQVMKKTSGKANPSLVSQSVVEELKRR